MRSLCICTSLVSRSVARVATFLRNDTMLKKGFSRSRAVLVACQEAVVVVELDGAERFVLRELIALGNLDGVGPVAIALGCDKLVNRFHTPFSCSISCRVYFKR